MNNDLTIGILALQGDYDAHRQTLHRLNVRTVLVRKPEELDEIDGLVIPGGESSTFLKFLEREGFLQKLREFVVTKPAFGTCAGASCQGRRWRWSSFARRVSSALGRACRFWQSVKIIQCS